MLGLSEKSPSLLTEESKIVDTGEPQVSKAEIAAVWVEKARSGSLQWVDSCSVSQMQAYQLKKRLKPVTTTAKYLLLLLGVLERPSWCLLDVSTCPGPEHPELHSAGLPLLGSTVSNWAAIVLWSYFVFVLYLRYKGLGDAHRLDSFKLFGIVLHMAAFLDCIVASVNVVGIFPGTFRVSRLLRPFIFLSYTRSIRQAGQRVLSSIPGFADALMALLFTVLLFTWFGLILFADTEEGDTYFSSWAIALSNMWILFTTANSPDVYVPVYTRHRSSMIFFFVYLVLTLYLISNILLAFVFDSYKTQLKDYVKTHFKNQAKAMRRAFALLKDEKGSIPPGTWIDFFNAYFAHHHHSWDVRSGSNIAQQVFNALDKDHSMGIDEGEFQAVLKILLDSETYIAHDHVVAQPDKASVSARFFRWRKSLQKACFTIHGTKPAFPWDDLMDALIFVGVVLTFVQTIFFLGPSTNMQEWFMTTYKVMAVFSFVYIAELTIKICILGAHRFWFTKVFFHRIDFFNVYGLCAVEIFNLVTQGENPIAIRIAILLHITRSLRVLRHIEALNFITQMLIRLAPTYWRMSMLLVLVYYTYATIGVEVFGGDIYEGNPALVGSEYAEGKYWPFNFNDFASGMVTLFVLMVGNNWQIFAKAFIAATHTRFTAIFFVSFAVIANLIVLNILMALILECSQSLREELENAPDDDESSDDEVPHPASSDFSYESMIRKVLLDPDDLAEIERETSSYSVSPASQGQGQSRASYGSV